MISTSFSLTDDFSAELSKNIFLNSAPKKTMRIFFGGEKMGRGSGTVI